MLQGLRAGISHFHAVKYMKDELKNNGFCELKEADKWALEAGKSYFFTRNHSTIVAFTLGNQIKNTVDLFKIVGCHTDSPVLKLAPVAKLDNRCGFQQLNMQTYGGGLWRTWFDRDLGLAGRIITQGADKSIKMHLWDSKSAVMNIPNLCIHLDRAEEFKPNKEAHLKPILATKAIDQLFGEGITSFQNDKQDVFNIENKHFKTFLSRIAEDLGVAIEDILDFELAAYDHHPAAIIGLHNEFVSSPRLDNLASSLCSLDALVEFSKSGNNENSEVSMVMLFDHEEIGSQSAQGADSNMVVESTERILAGVLPSFTREDYYRSIRRSFFISADMAHAIHPNYADKHQSNHQPKIHEGIVLKINCNQRYTTDAISASILKVLAAQSTPPVPLQEFMVK